MEITGASVVVKIDARKTEKCDGVDDHWTWTAPDWGYEEDGKCYGSREEAVVAGQDSIRYQLETLFQEWERS